MSDNQLRAEELLAHAGWVRALVRELVADDSRVDDIVQQAWLAALERRPVHVLRPRAWLAGVIRNLIRENRRSEARRRRREERSAQPEQLPSAETLVEKAELQKRVVEAVLDLEDPYRSTLLLRYFEELTAEEIARQAGVPSSTIRNRMKRGLALLRERFDREQREGRHPWRAGLALLAPPRAGDTKAFSLLAAAAVLTVGGSFWLVSSPVGNHDEPPAGSSSPQAGKTAGSEAEAAPKSREPLGPTRSVHGLVADAAGKPVDGARVFIGAVPQPFSGEPTHGLLVQGSSYRGLEDDRELRVTGGEDSSAREGAVLGKVFETGTDGTYEVYPLDPGPVFVTVLSSPGVRAEQIGRWTAVPGSGIDFTVQRLGVAQLSVSVVDLATGEPLDEFRGTISGLGSRPRKWSATAASFHDTIELPDGAATLTVDLTEPAWARASRQIHLQSGSEESIEFSVHSGGGAAGRVLDADGLPVPDALVFWGDQWRMRRDSIYNSWDPGQIFDGVRTDEQGAYRLSGQAALLTVWHPDHSAETVLANLAGSIQLSPRGGIAGRLLEDGGRPRAGAVVILDRKRRVTTDFEGRFGFDDVEAGVHGISVDEMGLGHLMLNVSPGEVTDLGDSPLPFQKVEVELRSGGDPFTEEITGKIIGLTRISTQHEFRARDGVFSVRRILPGRYLTIDSRGRLAAFTVASETAVADVGTATLEVVTAHPSHIFIVPADTSDAVHLFSRTVSEERDRATRVVFSPLPRGRYQIGIAGRGIVEEILVGTDDLVVTLQ